MPRIHTILSPTNYSVAFPRVFRLEPEPKLWIRISCSNFMLCDGSLLFHLLSLSSPQPSSISSLYCSSYCVTLLHYSVIFVLVVSRHSFDDLITLIQMFWCIVTLKQMFHTPHVNYSVPIKLSMCDRWRVTQSVILLFQDETKLHMNSELFRN